MLDQSLGFQGMFRAKRNAEENEDNMASRLQIEMGESPVQRGSSLISVLDREKGTGSKRSQNIVDVFRGVSFDDWLQLTMEAINLF